MSCQEIGFDSVADLVVKFYNDNYWTWCGELCCTLLPVLCCTVLSWAELRLSCTMLSSVVHHFNQKFPFSVDATSIYYKNYILNNTHHRNCQSLDPVKIKQNV